MEVLGAKWAAELSNCLLLSSLLLPAGAILQPPAQHLEHKRPKD